MRRKIIIAVIAALAGSFFWCLSHPLPKYEGHHSSKGLSKSVDIYTDAFGVPHIMQQDIGFFKCPLLIFP